MENKIQPYGNEPENEGCDVVSNEGTSTPVINDATELSEQAEFKGMFWVYGGLMGIAMIAPGVAIATLTPDDEDPLEVAVWLKVGIPYIVWTIVQLGYLASLSNKFGMDIVQERDLSVSIKESMRTTLTNLALVSALLLTVVIGMLLQNDLEDTLVTKWYALILLLSVAQNCIAVLVSVLGTLYLEPLSEEAATRFIFENLIYFGEPMTMTIAGFVNFSNASLLYVFGAYGFEIGILGAVVFWFVVMRVSVTYQYLSCWKNPYLTEEERDERSRLLDKIIETDKSAKTLVNIRQSSLVVPSPQQPAE